MDETMLPGPLPVETLWQRTEKPVLLFTENDEAFDPRYFFRYNKRLVQAAGIDEDSARRVLDKITCKTSVESLRIAGIILKNIAQLHNV